MGAKELLQKAMFDIANDLQTELITTAPVSSGRLKGSIKVKATKTGLIISMVEYGKYVEYGTNPHVINVKDKEVLADKQKRIFGKRVKHPGNRPNPFIRTAIRLKLKGIIEKNLKIAAG